MRSPYYGELHIAYIPNEIRTLWYSRDDEPEQTEPFGWSWDQIVDPDYETEDFARRVIDATPLTERELQVLGIYFVDNASLRETACEMGVTTERVRQILHKALKRLKRRVDDGIKRRLK